MSRWVNQFEAHPFQATWTSLKILLDSATVDDATVITSVTELARLKKVISYLDEMIKSIDPELVPMTTWDSFNQQAVACSQQMTGYQANRNIAHVVNANAHADNLLTYIRPYMVVPESVEHILQNAIKSYASTIAEYGESFRRESTELVNEINNRTIQSKELLTSIESTKNEINQYHIELFGIDTTDGGIQSKVKELVDDFKVKYDDIVKHYIETFVGDAKTPSIKAEILATRESILADRVRISTLLDEVSVEVQGLTEFYNKIFGKANEDGVEERGLAGELDDRMQALTEFERSQNAKYKALIVQIEGLLPGATSAGLASAYHDMKVSFDKPIKYASTGFYVAIGLLVFASFLLAIDTISFSSISFVKIGTWDEVLRGVTNKLPFYAPILWLAYYASKRRSEYQRLQQEYAHKEALAKSYDSYKRQIEELDVEDMEMQKVFIMKAIDAIAYNASTTLDGKHGDKMPALEVVEKVVDEMSKIQKIFKPAEKSEGL